MLDAAFIEVMSVGLCVFAEFFDPDGGGGALKFSKSKADSKLAFAADFGGEEVLLVLFLFLSVLTEGPFEASFLA